jgi:hypothetical protein
LKVLEPIADPRTLAPARAALRDHDEDVAAAAAHVLGGLLEAREPAIAAGALDGLVTAALDAGRPRRVRVAAYSMLRDLPEEMRSGVGEALGFDPDAAAETPTARSPRQAEKIAWTAALQGQLPEHASQLRDLLPSRVSTMPLASLQKLIDAVRLRENAVEHAEDWRAIRGTLHQALTARGSRLALYDLRESFAAASAPLPVSFLSAMQTIGDRSCLESLAEAHAKAAGPEEWWRQQLASAFRTILTREGLTRRSAMVKKILARWPEAVAMLETRI